MIITIYGSSDDLIEVEGCEGADEFNSYEQGLLMWRGDLVAPDGSQMRVHAVLDGCWSFAVGMVDEGAPLPRWPLTIDQGGAEHSRPGYPTYSTVVLIDAPEGTRLTNVWPART
jgi:hypothetical protein